MRAMRYAPHRLLTDPARPSASLWRLAGGVAATTALFLALSLAYGFVSAILLPPAAWGPDGMGIAEATTATGASVNLLAFALLIASLAAVLPLLHKRSIATLIGPAARAIAQARRVTLFVVAIYAAVMLVTLLDPFGLSAHLSIARWTTLLPLTILGLVVQTSAEELVFRGYLQSQLAARFRHPAVWMVIPSVLFGLLHYQPGLMGGAAWLMVIWAMLFGLAAADLTARSGTLGPAIALHLVNNFSAIAVTATSGYFDGLALFTYPFGPDDTAVMLRWMPVDLMALACSWLAARLALRA